MNQYNYGNCSPHSCIWHCVAQRKNLITTISTWLNTELELLLFLSSYYIFTTVSGYRYYLFIQSLLINDQIHGVRCPLQITPNSRAKHRKIKFSLGPLFQLCNFPESSCTKVKTA